jgi:hypothetical protein
VVNIRTSWWSAVGLSSLALASQAGGEVLSVASNGFEVRSSVHVAASSEQAYAALLLPARWWSSDHTFSGNAANLTLDARAGGCWCERLPGGGSAEHLQVVYIAPGKSLRLRGALGPFQSMGVAGAMTWTVASAANGADITWIYTLGGYSKEGFEKLAPVADRVLSEQIAQLKKYIESTAAAAH